MSIKPISYSIFFLLLFSLFSCQQATDEKVDLIVHNATVYTVDKGFTKAEAFAIQDGKFIAVGTSKDILDNYQSEQKLDARRLSIFPGFYDAHAHFYGLSEDLAQVDLRQTQSMGEVIERLNKHIEANPDQEWIIGRGWDQNLWGYEDLPTNDSLNAAFPDKKIALIRIDAHALLVNDKSLKAANFTPETEIPGGVLVKKNGRLTGMLLEAAKDKLLAFVPKPSEAKMREQLLKAQEVCFEQGITSLSDAGLDKEIVELYRKMQEEGTLKIRINAMLNPTKENKAFYLPKGPVSTDRLTVRCFKFYADGALGSRGAYLLEPYADAPETRGVLRIDSATFAEEIKELHEKGFQVATHCIGDGANRVVLNAYAEVLKIDNDKRWRIEHAQVVHPQDFDTFQRYRILPSVQPTHAISDMEWADERLGEERLKNAYAFQDLYELNDLIVFGTDFPVEEPNQIYTFHAATARQNAYHKPAEGFLPENAVEPRTAIRAMTHWPAFAAFEEDKKGTIEPGKLADFVILDTDIMDTDKRLLRNTRVVQTFINGESVYSGEGM